MKKFLDENCGENNLFDVCVEKQIKNSEIEQHTQDCLICRDVSNESRKLKNLLKRAVGKEFAPQSLMDSIRREIRR